MASTLIVVQHSDGSPARSARVCLSFEAALGGVTEPVFTDQYGYATVMHSTRAGWAKVIVNGRKRGRFHAPGTFAVTINHW